MEIDDIIKLFSVRNLLCKQYPFSIMNKKQAEEMKSCIERKRCQLILIKELIFWINFDGE